MKEMPRAVLDWLCSGRADYREFRDRRQTARFRARRGQCKTIWICSGVLMLLHPTVPFVATMVLVTTLLCLALLDESED